MEIGAINGVMADRLAAKMPRKKHPGGRPKKTASTETKTVSETKPKKKNPNFLKKPAGLSVTEWKTASFTVRCVNGMANILHNSDGLSFKVQANELQELCDLVRYVGKVVEMS